MNFISLKIFALFLVVICPAVCFSQTIIHAKAIKIDAKETTTTKSSPAYAEVLLRKTELLSELESLILDYTEEYPKVVEIRYSLVVLQKESDRMLAVKPADASKLTLALGKLIVRKIELETDLWQLLRSYKDNHPDVKRAKRKVEIYEAAIKEILG